MIWLIWAIAVGLSVRLLFLVPLAELSNALHQVNVLGIARVLLVDLVIMMASPFRLWLLLREEGRHVPYAALVRYRLASAAVSYVTPGPQFGGEPLQVHLLAGRHKVPVSLGAAVTILERAIELVGNLTFLVFGLTTMAIQSGTGLVGMWPVIGTVVLVTAILIGYLIAATAGFRPVAAMALALNRLMGKKGGGRIFRRVHKVEMTIGRLCRRLTRIVAIGLLVSYITWFLVVWEYRLMLNALAIHLSVLESVATLALARLSLLSPIPGAIALLEATQVVGLRMFGRSEAAGLAIGLLMRMRDLLFVVAGLLFAIPARGSDKEES